MSDSEALLGKADALLLRLRSSPTTEFPVLTEVVDLTHLSRDQTEPSPTPLFSTPGNGIDIDDLCQHLRRHLTESLERAVMQWTDDSFIAKLRQEIEPILQLSLERAMEDSRAEVLLRIRDTLARAIDTEVRAHFSRRD